MENFEVALIEDSQGVVLKAHSISIDINRSAMTGFPGSAGLQPNLDTMNITIQGKLDAVLRDGTVQSSTMPTLSILGNEMNNLISGMTAGPEKDAAQAKLSNFEVLLIGIRGAVTTFLKEQYLLDNPKTDEA